MPKVFVGTLLLGTIIFFVVHTIRSRSRLSMPSAPFISQASSTIETTRFGSPTTTEEEWKRILSPETFRIMREAGTEVPFSSPLDFETRPGTYVSADCGEPLFRSEQKYDSGTGWPSFWAPIDPSAVKLVEDKSLFETRTEVMTAKCGGHLGHVFDDGPQPTGKRYCMNGAALRFIPDATTTITNIPSPSDSAKN